MPDDGATRSCAEWACSEGRFHTPEGGRRPSPRRVVLVAPWDQANAPAAAQPRLVAGAFACCRYAGGVPGAHW